MNRYIDDDLTCVCCGREILSGSQYCSICGYITKEEPRQANRISKPFLTESEVPCGGK